MSAYAIAHLRSIDLNEEILVYLRRIDASLEPLRDASSSTASSPK